MERKIMLYVIGKYPIIFVRELLRLLSSWKGLGRKYYSYNKIGKGV